MGTVEVGDGQVAATFVFPPSFAGFQGHFPGNPILPGVCQIQAALVLLAAARRVPVALRETVAAKFMSVVQPGAPIRIVCRETLAPDGTALVRAEVAGAAARIAELKLRVAYGPAAGTPAP